MKSTVEWGIPKHAVKNNRPCGVEGQFIVQSVSQACKLARQLFFTLTQGSNMPAFLGVNKDNPRAVFWSDDLTVWIAISLLDGVPRGSYGAKADKEGARLLALRSTEDGNTVTGGSMSLRDEVNKFLVKSNGWAIHATHLDPLKNAKTDEALKVAVRQFLAKVDEGWSIHPSHLAPMRNALEA